jgi:hypothetical protein
MLSKPERAERVQGESKHDKMETVFIKLRHYVPSDFHVKETNGYAAKSLLRWSGEFDSHTLLLLLLFSPLCGLMGCC